MLQIRYRSDVLWQAASQACAQFQGKSLTQRQGMLYARQGTFCHILGGSLMMSAARTVFCHLGCRHLEG